MNEKLRNFIIGNDHTFVVITVTCMDAERKVRICTEENSVCACPGLEACYSLVVESCYLSYLDFVYYSRPLNIAISSVRLDNIDILQISQYHVITF